MIPRDPRITTTTAVTPKGIVMDPAMNLLGVGRAISTVQSLRDNNPYLGVRARHRPIQLGPLLNLDCLRRPLPLSLHLKYGILQSPSHSPKSPLP
jgi:hypothetical protein